MTDLKKKAQRLAAKIFGVTLDHITAAPKYCGDGYDGACDRTDCEIVGAVPIIATALLETRQLALISSRKHDKKSTP